MSTSLLYHMFGLRNQEYTKADYVHGTLELFTRTKEGQLRCSCCGSDKVKKRGFKIRRFKTLPIGSKRVFIMARIQRLECLDCGMIRQEKIEFSEPVKAYTRSLKRLVLSLTYLMTIKDIALYLGMTWDTVKDIQKENLQKKYGKPNLKELVHIGIDEISVKKGHKYVTLVMDMDTGAIVYVGDGKGSESLIPFWKSLKRAGAAIESVAIDMSRAYIDAVQSNLKSASIVFDHFHIVKLFNDKLTELRREIYNSETVVEKKTLKRNKVVIA